MIPTETRAPAPAPELADATGGRAGGQVDLARLERAVLALVERDAALRDQNQKLASDVAERDRRIAELEGELRRQNQTRRDVALRIDALVGQIDQLESRLTARAESPE